MGARGWSVVAASLPPPSSPLPLQPSAAASLSVPSPAEGARLPTLEYGARTPPFVAKEDTQT